MNWWNILKNAKISGRSKCKSFDASKIKINIDKDDCKKKLTNLLESAMRMDKEKNLSHLVPEMNTYNLNSFFEQHFLNQMPEERACEYLKTIKYKFPQKLKSDYTKLFQIYPVPKSQSGSDYYYVFIEKFEEEGDVEITITFKQGYINWATINFKSNEDYAKWLALA